MTSRDSTTIAQLNMELRKINVTLSESKAEIAKLQKEVLVKCRWWALNGPGHHILLQISSMECTLILYVKFHS